MKLSTGKIAFPIEFDNGDKQNIYFNPNDPDLFVRFSEVKDRIKNQIEQLPDFEMNADGTPKEDADLEVFKRSREIMCKEVDRAFGGDVSSVVFKYCNPLAIVDGQYFIWHFLEAVAPEMRKHIEQATSKAEQNINKHIAKYVK